MSINRRIKHTFSTITFFLIGMFFSASVVWACALFGNKLAREDNQGAVKVSATYIVPKDGEGNNVSFQLTLDTHSVNLGEYDLEKISFIQFDEKEPVSGGVWDFTGSGHHFKGIITFNGQIPPGTQKVRLLIRGVANVKERVLEWSLPLG
jgi:hypothetical protein